ncbi:radical SAM protein [Sporohalobacter salinus]|uniref:radical SAM protein n=1 Tax=Sporohalobacter salinus TaxID=1494606 RepID=UPI00195FBD0F|nr:radical SAM protein [Sporohalobacter salinus]MBM7622794.1 wyosine [tRNA(Phe)-imidazoG37] synthetase (radical SAM superfamily) [Sporohalobacter salinus]
MDLNHVFGPVPSRRLGVSLGIDLLSNKICTFDCVYCECGVTTELTSERKEYISTKEVIKELDHFLQTEPELDYITFSGSGEPTLHNKIGKIVSFLKNNYPDYKLALLTNGSFFAEQGLLDEISEIDLIVPSLDAVSEDTFEEINRPCTALSIDDIINGLINLSKNYEGEIWLEIFILSGVNDTKKEIEAFKEVIERVNPQRVQLNTLDRPGAEDWIESVVEERLKQIAADLGDKVEIIASFKPRKEIKSFNQELKNEIIDLLKKRPCTNQDLAEILSIHANEVSKYIQTLLDDEIIEKQDGKRGIFYIVKEK